jgi:hypothetical protein
MSLWTYTGPRGPLEQAIVLYHSAGSKPTSKVVAMMEEPRLLFIVGERLGAESEHWRYFANASQAHSYALTAGLSFVTLHPRTTVAELREANS